MLLFENTFNALLPTTNPLSTVVALPTPRPPEIYASALVPAVAPPKTSPSVIPELLVVPNMRMLLFAKTLRALLPTTNSLSPVVAFPRPRPPEMYISLVGAAPPIRVRPTTTSPGFKRTVDGVLEPKETTPF